MKKIAKISLLVLLGLGLAGCHDEYDWDEESGQRNSYAKIISEIASVEYVVSFDDEYDTDDFIETINNSKFENIDFVEKKDDLTVIVKFKDFASKKSSDETSSSKNVKEEIVEKDGKKYKVTVEEITESQSKNIAEEAVGKATKSSSSE